MVDGAITPLIIGLLLVVLAAQGGIWYKLGRMESKVQAHLRDHTTGRLTHDD